MAKAEAEKFHWASVTERDPFPPREQQVTALVGGSPVLREPAGRAGQMYTDPGVLDAGPEVVKSTDSVPNLLRTPPLSQAGSGALSWLLSLLEPLFLCLQIRDSPVVTS